MATLRSIACSALLILAACGSPAAEGPADYVSGIDLINIDPAVHPGDDFFGYVNGKWLARTEIPPDRTHVGTFPTLREATQEKLREIVEVAARGNFPKGSPEQKMGALYRSFMDTDGRDAKGIEPLEAEFATIAAIADLEDLARYFGRANTYGSSMPVDIDQSVDWNDPSNYALVVSQGGLGLPDRDYYLNDDGPTGAIRAHYLAHIEEMFELAGLPAGATAAAAIMTLETRLAAASMPKEALRRRAVNFRPFRRAELGELMPHFEWELFLAEYGTPDIDELVVYTKDYLAALDAILLDTDLETWKSYLQWKALNAAAAALSSDLDEQNFLFYGRVLAGTMEQRPLWRRGIGVVDSALGELLGQAYVAEHFRPEAKQRILDLVANLIRAYEQSLAELDWMSDDTRIEALEKLSRFRAKVGYPDVWRDYPAEIRPNDLLGNLRRAALAEHRRQLDRHGGPVDRDEWRITPQTVNAYYSPALNEIVFPAAILQPPFFNPEADDAVNYGAIGAVIGHEIGHGFDDQGSTFDGDGRLRNWWTDADRDEFDRRTAKLTSQYNTYRPFADLPVNGEFTQGENIGDLGGISIALLAYRLSLAGCEAPVIDGVTGEQRVFIGFAQIWRNKYRDAYLRQMLLTDPHAPGKYRTNGAVRNIPAFYDAFDVAPGDALYLPPEERVKIW